MSEKPFWEGKTCKEMAGLHVKVTYENGDVLTGVTDEDGDIEYAYTLSDGSVDDKFIPRDFIESIELVDDPECERIDDIGDVRVGDVYVATDGNEYTVTALNKATADPPPEGRRVLVIVATPDLPQGGSGVATITRTRPHRLQPWGGVPMFLSTPWGVDVSGFRLAVVGALRPAGGVRRPFPCGPVQATRAGSW
jgi:hypothetical protein